MKDGGGGWGSGSLTLDWTSKGMGTDYPASRDSIFWAKAMEKEGLFKIGALRDEEYDADNARARFS